MAALAQIATAGELPSRVVIDVWHLCYALASAGRRAGTR